MKPLQTGTKVLIEATVESIASDNSIIVKAKSGYTLWLRPSDLTVCETAEVDPKKQQVKAGDILKLVSDFGSDFTKGKDYPVLKVYEDEGRSVFVIKPDTKGMPEQSFYGSRIGSDFIIVNEDGAEPQPIDPNNFMVDITNPVNTKLLPGFKEYVKRVYYAQNKKYVIDRDWTIYRFVEVRDGVIDLTNNEFMKLTTLPELQKQHPGVFDETKLVDLTCMGCGKSFKGEEPKMCCSGKDCGCMGQPIDPIICSKECYYKLPHMKSKATPTPSFKAGQEVPKHGDKIHALKVSEWVDAIYCCPHPNQTSALKHLVTDVDGIITWSTSAIRPIPAQPTVESDNKLKCTDCGAPMNEGERKTFTCCGECWNKTYVHSNMAETKINTEVDELKDMLTNCKFTIQDILAWHQKYTRLSSELRNLLEDVVNELELSDGMIEKHGPLGTEPSKLVRLVLDQKDQQIKALKAGMIDIKHSGRVEVSVPTKEEIMSVFSRNVKDSPTVAESYYNAVEPTVRHFMTRKEQQG